MKTIELEVKYGRTVNMGNYESLRIEFCQRVSLAENEGPTPLAWEEMTIALRKEVHRCVGGEMAFLHGEDKPKRIG
jgi:hypothetical protein